MSYLASRPSRDIIIAARQELTREVWRALLAGFEVFVSALVVEEAGKGDAEAAAERLKALDGIPVLDLTDHANALARTLVDRQAIPHTSAADAVHVAVAATNGMDFLLTWNFAHLNNALTRFRIREVVGSAGYHCPELCSPEELLGEKE